LHRDVYMKLVVAAVVAAACVPPRDNPPSTIPRTTLGDP
jgi:hypothetical protein